MQAQYALLGNLSFRNFNVPSQTPWMTEQRTLKKKKKKFFANLAVWMDMISPCGMCEHTLKSLLTACMFS